MAQNLTINGVTYNSVASLSIPKSGGGNAAFPDTSDADAVAGDIATGKTAYVNGTKLTGTGGIPTADTLENTSWADIAAAAANGTAKMFWNIGDRKTITFGSAVYGSTSISVEIVAFDYDDLAAGGKAKITFCMVDSFATAQKINNSSTNSGGWTSSVLRAALASTLLPAFEGVVGTGVIKPVSKRTSAGTQSATINTTTDSLWLVSEFEVLETTASSKAGEKPTDQAYRYPLFYRSTARIKKVGASAADWWCRSPSASDNYYFCRILNTGAIGTADPNTTKGVAVGFCV